MNVNFKYTAITVPKAPVEGAKPPKKDKVVAHFYRN
jgi:hypothetical protein